MAYATFTGDPHYHTVVSAADYRTMCNLLTKEVQRMCAESRLPAQISIEKPPQSSLFRLCPLCDAMRPETK